MEKKIKALALFSGGLDSALAVKVVKDQGVEVIGLNFVSHFFGGKNEKAEKIDSQIQFYLYDYLVDEYFNYLRENGYSNESDFLRDIFYEYIDKSRDERIDILKNI